MALANYTDLVSAVGAWLNKGTTLDARIPDFIRLTESRLNKILDDPEMEVSATLSLTSGSASLPADFGVLVSAADAAHGRIEQATAAQFSDFRSVSGDPRFFAIIGNSFKTAPSGSGSVSIVYRRTVPALTSGAPTNWLMTRAPEVYLYGCLLAAEFYGFNDERLGVVKAAYEEAIADLRTDASRRKWGGAPLAPRLARA